VSEGYNYTHVIAHIGEWAHVYRAEPDDIGAEVLDVVELAEDAREVTDAVAVGVKEGDGIDLVHDGGLPPGRRWRGHGSVVSGG
jgi:hypothetical protein